MTKRKETGFAIGVSFAAGVTFLFIGTEHANVVGFFTCCLLGSITATLNSRLCAHETRIVELERKLADDIAT